MPKFEAKLMERSPGIQIMDRYVNLYSTKRMGRLLRPAGFRDRHCRAHEVVRLTALSATQYPVITSITPTSGSPAANRRTFSTMRSARRGTIISGVSAECGVMSAAGWLQSG